MKKHSGSATPRKLPVTSVLCFFRALIRAMQDALRLRLQQTKDLATVFVRQFSGDELSRARETFQWVLETCDFDEGKGFQSIADWADACVSVGWAWMIKSGIVESLDECTDTIGVTAFAPNTSLGELTIADLRGSSIASTKADDLLHLHGVLQATSMVDHYPWLKSVVQDIELSHLDITGAWDTNMMTH